jgi:hypothetical protein
MRYLKINPKLFLAEQFVNSQPSSSKSVSGNLNHIWIYDRSGSMSGTLPQLARDLIAKAKTIPVGDTLTLGWFSSEGGEFNFMLKGFKITEKKDYKVLEDTINKNKHTIGATCFSEILADTKTVIKDLSAISTNFALCFFTDGYPVVGNYSKEIQAINNAISAIGSKIASSLLVGYGDYYNKELMTQMAERFGGSLIHSENLPTFSTQLDGFMKDARENGLKIAVDLDIDPGKDGLVFGINGQQINLFSHSGSMGQSGRQIDFIPTQGGRDSIFVLTDRAPKGEEVTLDESNLQRPTNRESIIRGVYAAAYLLTQKAKSDLALEVLGSIGDKDMIDSVNNAFTNAEYGRAEAKMQDAVINPKRRFMQGINKSYLPKPDAFCVLDAVKLLMQDEDAYFYPFHEAFEYKRIGAGSKTKAGYPEFEADLSAKCSLNKLTWNDTKLNLSVLAQISGHVELAGDYGKHGFGSRYPTYVWRNYALIKDGFLNVQRLPISASKETIDRLEQEGMVLPLSLEECDNGVYVIDLTKIPVINRAIADGKTSATELCKKAYREIQLEGTLKALNFFKSELDPDGKSKLGKGALTPDQEVYLKTQGIGRNGFSPETEKIPSTDFYMAKEFEIKMKGLSSLPSVKDVLEKSKKGGKLTPSMMLVKSGIDLYNQNLKKSQGASLSWVEEQTEKLKKELISVRSDIQETKFAVILGKKWFDEFSSREKNTLTLGGIEYTLSVGETKVEL